MAVELSALMRLVHRNELAEELAAVAARVGAPIVLPAWTISPCGLTGLGIAWLGMKGSTIRGHLDMLVLAVLADGALHGYAVIEELKARSGDSFDLPEGTIYPVLHRLEKEGLLVSAWSDAAGRRRRTYTLTRAGKGALAKQRHAWQAFSDAVGKVLGGAPWPAKI
jgi:PadR family transcriptional regulator PadR